MVDEGTTMGDLRGLLDQFAHAMFGAGKRTRFRPGYYPFTEPSVAFDVECLVCGGSGCPACSRTGWMTILGAGHGPPGRPRQRRARPRALPGVRLRDGRRADRQPAPRGRATCGCTWRTTSASWSSSDEGAAGLAARLRRRRPDAGGARRAPDPAGHGGQGHRALGRRMAVGGGRRAADGREAPAGRPPLADHRPGRRRRGPRDRLRRDEHRTGPAGPGRAAGRRPARRPADRAGREDGRRRATGCSAPATSWSSPPTPTGSSSCRPETPLGRRPERPLRRHGPRRRRQAEPGRRPVASSGLAREVAAATGAALRWPAIDLVEAGDAGRRAAERSRSRSPTCAPGSSAGSSTGVTRRSVARTGSRCASGPPGCVRSATSSTPRTT